MMIEEKESSCLTCHISVCYPCDFLLPLSVRLWHLLLRFPSVDHKVPENKMSTLSSLCGSTYLVVDHSFTDCMAAVKWRQEQAALFPSRACRTKEVVLQPSGTWIREGSLGSVGDVWAEQNVLCATTSTQHGNHFCIRGWHVLLWFHVCVCLSLCGPQSAPTPLSFYFFSHHSKDLAYVSKNKIICLKITIFSHF